MIFLVPAGSLFSQDLFPKLDQLKSLRKDSDNLYLNEIWIKSKDINKDDAGGFLRRASGKISLGYYNEAMPDVNKAISIDSTIGQSYYIKGFLQLHSDSVVSALENFKKAIALHDTGIYNYFILAETYARLMKFQEADSLFNKVISIDSKFYQAYFEMGNINSMRFKFEAAEKLYKKAIDLKPDFVQAYFNMAIMYMNNNTAEAMNYLNKSVKVDPSFAHAYFVRALLERTLNHIPAMYRNLNKAIELEPGDNSYRITLGFLHIMDKDFEKGFYEVSKVLLTTGKKDFFGYFEQSSRDKIINDFLSQATTFNSYSGMLSFEERDKLINALCLFFLGKFRNAEDIYKDLLSTSTLPGLLFYLRGFNAEYLHQAELSLENYNKSMVQDRFPAEACLRKGIVLNFLGKYDEAVPAFRTFISMNDSVRLAYRSLAGAYVNLSRYDSAIIELTGLIKSDSTELDVYFDRAFCYKNLQQYQDATRDCNHILKYKPFNVEANCLLAGCRFSDGDTTGAYQILNRTWNMMHYLTEEGHFIRGTINLLYMKYDSAIYDFSRVLRYNPDHLEALIYRGLCYYCKEDFKNAREDLSAALYRKNDDITALYSRGLTNLRLNDRRGAYNDLRRADALGHPLAKRAIADYLKDYKPPDQVR